MSGRVGAEQTPDIQGPANELREASALMRERAEAADALGKIADIITTSTCDEFAEHIASWHPLVAFAVADWLDKAARAIDRVPDWVAPATPECVFAEAFAVARAYLGASA